MSVELSQDFNQLVKKVDFFPYEWSSNLLAVCFADSVKFFIYNESRKEEIEPAFDFKSSHAKDASINRRLQLIATVPFQQKVVDFSWSPKTTITSLKQIISFAVSDCAQQVVFCTLNLNASNEQANQASPLNLKMIRETVDVDCIFRISYDSHNGELLAFTADTYCFIWDCVESKLKTRFQLQSPGVNICWNRNEKTKLVVGEKSGLIRIYNIETCKCVYTLTCQMRAESWPLLALDWCETNPETIVGITSANIFIWNTFKSCLPDQVIENYSNLRTIKLYKLKENLIGFVDGKDAASKLTIMNMKSSQVLYQSDIFKLFSSFSMNIALPLIAIANEQRLTVIKMIN